MSKKNFISLGLIALLVLSSCTASSQETKRATQGTILGAVLGAVIGNQSDNKTSGAIIGAVVGGTIGYYIGTVETRKVKSAEETEKSMQYSSTDGLKVNIASINVNPAEVKSGQEADLDIQLALADSDRTEDIKVNQKIAIFKGTEQIGDTIEKNFTFKPGTHEITRSIKFQNSTVPGKYTFVTHITAHSGGQKSVDYMQTSFDVI